MRLYHPPETQIRLDPNFGYGAIAQLGERLHGMQEVSGSIPLSSTKFFKTKSNRLKRHAMFVCVCAAWRICCARWRIYHYRHAGKCAALLAFACS
jgi:hypothetical protein